MANALNDPAVPLPRGVWDLLLLTVPEGELNHGALEAIVVEAVREHFISRRKAASLMGLTNYLDREAFFKRHGFHNEYTLEMVEEHFSAIRSLEAKQQA